MPVETHQKENLKTKHREQLKMLNELSHRLKNVLSAGNVYKETLKIVRSRFDYYYISLWTMEADGATAVLQAHEGAYANFLSPGFRLKGEGIIGLVIETRKPYFSNDTSTDSNFTSLKLPIETKSALAVPILDADEKIIGALNVEAKEAGAFDDEDLNVMESIGAQVSLALSNAHLYNEVNDMNRQLQSLVDAKTQELREAHQRILEQQKLLQKENRALKTIVNRTNEREFVGQSQAVSSLLYMVDKIAPTRVSVLIQGESGTGKELIASRIHRVSDRLDKPFVIINCGALQESLLESELFGHEKGSFTGAVAQKIGLAETADGGTLFLDEIGEMSLSIQAKLLRFLQEGEMYRIGGKQPICVDVRVLSATNRDLEQEVKAGRFREDLFYRLNTITLRVPPLRKRSEDVPLLVRSFLENARVGSARHLSISARAMEALKNYEWPGNIRELQNTIEQLKILAEGPEVKLEDLPFNIRMAQGVSRTIAPTAPGEMTLALTLDDLEKNHILQMLSYHHGNKTKTAKVLGITIKTLYNKLHRYGLLESEGDMLNN